MKNYIQHREIGLQNPDKKIQVSFYWREAQESLCTLLILPGLDESFENYESFFNQLALQFPHHSLLSIDLRGQGRTLEAEGRINTFSITIDHQIQIINDIVCHLNLQNVFVIGLSYGAGVGLCLANRLSCVDGLALLAPYVSKFKNFNRGVSGLWYTLAHMNPFYKVLSYFSLPVYFQIARERGRLNPQVHWDHVHMNALTKLSTGIMNISTTKEARQLKNLPQGIHILIGENDDLVSVNAVKHLLKQIQIENKTFKILPHSGHRLLIKDYNECANWLSGIIKA